MCTSCVCLCTHAVSIDSVALTAAILESAGAPGPETLTVLDDPIVLPSLLVCAPAHQNDCMVQLCWLQGAALVTVHTLTAKQQHQQSSQLHTRSLLLQLLACSADPQTHPPTIKHPKPKVKN